MTSRSSSSADSSDGPGSDPISPPNAEDKSSDEALVELAEPVDPEDALLDEAPEVEKKTSEEVQGEDAQPRGKVTYRQKSNSLEDPEPDFGEADQGEADNGENDVRDPVAVLQVLCFGLLPSTVGCKFCSHHLSSKSSEGENAPFSSSSYFEDAPDDPDGNWSLEWPLGMPMGSQGESLMTQSLFESQLAQEDGAEELVEVPEVGLATRQVPCAQARLLGSSSTYLISMQEFSKTQQRKE